MDIIEAAIIFFGSVFLVWVGMEVGIRNIKRKFSVWLAKEGSLEQLYKFFRDFIE